MNMGLENLIVYDDGRKACIDGKYYILKKDIPDPKNRKTVWSKGGKNYITEPILYDAFDKKIIAGEEIFGEDKDGLPEISLDFIGRDTFLAYGLGWREDMIMYSYQISDSKPKFLYRVHGGDCSFIFNMGSLKIAKRDNMIISLRMNGTDSNYPLGGISQDSFISLGREITGTYDGGQIGEGYGVLRFKDTIIKKYPVDSAGIAYPLNNGRWLESEKNIVTLYGISDSHQEYKKINSLTLKDSQADNPELSIQDNFLVIVENTKSKESAEKLLTVYNKNTLDKLTQTISVIGDDAFYIDPLDYTTIRTGGIKRKNLYSIRSSPAGRYVIVKAKEGVFVYEYKDKRLSNKQEIFLENSFCFRQI